MREPSLFDLLGEKRPLETAVGLFAGQGALEYAAHLAGLRVLAAYEWNEVAAHVHREAVQATRPEAGYPVLVADITQVESIPQCDIGLAGIPCQPFSPEGEQQGMEDRRGAPMWEATARLFSGAGARVVLVENVDEAEEAARTEGAAIFARYGFPHCKTVILRASDYGSGQVRARLWATYSVEPIDWEPEAGEGPRPVQDFLLTEADAPLLVAEVADKVATYLGWEPEDLEDPDLLEEAAPQVVQLALEPCYLGARSQEGLIDVRLRKHGSSGRGLRAVPVNHAGTIAGFTRSYWKAGASCTFLADRCLHCGYQVSAYDSFLYVTSVDRGEEVLWSPAHVFCWDCLETLREEGTFEAHKRPAPAGSPLPYEVEFEAIGPIDLGEIGMPELHDYLLRRLAAGATSCRRFHPREIARMFGLPDTWPLNVAHSVAAELLGNSLHVPTATAVLKAIIKAA